MKIRKLTHKKNLALNTVFIVLTTASLIVALTVAYRFTSKYIYNEFERNKIDVLNETIKPYNDFFHNKVPEISFYQGYLDSASAAHYSDTVLQKFPFVHKIIFYDTEISNHIHPFAFTANNLSIVPRAIYQFGRSLPADSIILYNGSKNATIKNSIDEFNKMAAKLSAYLQNTDTAENIANEDLLNVFYNVTPNRVTFMNVPREEELKTFKSLMLKNAAYSPEFEQDILSFTLNPQELAIKNIHPKLYQNISILPITFEPLNNTNTNYISTELPLSGAFSDYKLYFISSPGFLSMEVSRQFLPVALVILVVYSILIFIGLLIYRNLQINNKLFKLQYDFINNLTHEFKTPVSVIKIAGNNIRSASQLSDAERMHYGKILDEEADKLNDLMNKLLSFTQIENHSITIKNSRVNLEVFIQNMVDSYQLKYPEFEITYLLNRLEYFNTDPVLLSSLFQNLIDNAYKYSLPNRKKLHIDVSYQKGNVIFRFKDKGIGIPKSEVQNIFQKFYRIHSAYNQQGSVGLGLAFCKELVNFMQGDISVKSKPGQGSEFIIVLPYI